MTLNLLSLACADAARQLGNHLWQSTLFAGVVALIALALRKHQARVRYWLWVAASLKFLIPLALLIALGSHLGKPNRSTESRGSMYVAVDKISQPFTSATAFDAPAVSSATQPAAPRSWVALVPVLLGVAWLGGFVAVLGSWCVQWRRIAKVVEEARPLLDGRELEALHQIELSVKIPRRIKILTSRGSLEPGVVGIVHPILLWPEGISRHLDDAHLEAVIAHEVCHVQRRDNLTSVVHMLVEAIFWFHPLVWWMERRLVEERERACDESVLEICNRPQVYAESLVKVCEFCVESPLTCISGITGADLKRRIGRIMADSIARKLGLGARLLLLAAGLVAVGAPIMLGQMKGARVAAAVKASARAAVGALSFASRVASPIEPESATPSDTLIALQAVREFQLKPVELAQADAAEAGRASGSAQTGQTSSETDSVPVGWGLAGSKPQNYRTGIDPQMLRDGLPSAYLVSKLQATGGFGTLSQVIQATEYTGKRVRLRAWVRSDNVTDWAGLWLRVDRGQTVISLDNMQQRAIRGSQPWMTYDVVLDVPEDATQIAFGLLLSGPGEVWLNDVKLEAVGQDVPTTGMAIQNSRPTTPVNLDFQTPPCTWPELKPNPLNLDFSQGNVGSAPTAWLGPDSFMTPHVPVYEALIADGNQCHSGGRCATVHSLGSDSPNYPAFLMQELDASLYRGQTLIYRAFVRVDPNSKGVGRLLVRVHRKNCSTTFRDDMGDHPVVSDEWAAYEIRAPIATDAYQIEFGVQLVGTGAVWIDNISMEFKP
jgi:beta-lactamase regulating signal transducer with metallopeptidase domain